MKAIRMKAMRLKALAFSLSLLLALNVNASTENLQAHVKFLSSDALEGRLAGSEGEKLATDYIAKRFQELGLVPAGDNGTYFQTFDFTAGVSLGKKNSLTTQKTLTLNQDWRPLSFSANVAFTNQALMSAGYGITAPDYDSYKSLNVKDKWVIVYRYLPTDLSKEQKRQLRSYSSLRLKAFNAKEHGARGIIFVNPPNYKGNDELIPLALDTTLASSGIAALSVKKNVLKNDMKISGQVDLQKNIRHGRNVLATLKINPNAQQLLVIGAHVDHLGHGEISSHAIPSEKGMIHHGADDNASGIACMLEAAAKLTHLKAHHALSGNQDILFAAWSGEEFGVLGSNHFMTQKHSRVTAAFNLDMVGHLREKVAIQGTGSSLEWAPLIRTLRSKGAHFFITQDDPYLPTDSTSFYLQGIPTLNFFTGAHEHYHTPRDTYESLNYVGMQQITDLLVDFSLLLEKTPKALAFHQVKKTNNHSERSSKIYLGTIPDYLSTDVSGVKLGGITRGSPADLAGLKASDIIIELANKPIHHIYDYTFVLNTLTVGKPVKLVVLRQNSQVALKITARYR